MIAFRMDDCTPLSGSGPARLLMTRRDVPFSSELFKSEGDDWEGALAARIFALRGINVEVDFDRTGVSARQRDLERLRIGIAKYELAEELKVDLDVKPSFRIVLLVCLGKARDNFEHPSVRGTMQPSLGMPGDPAESVIEAAPSRAELPQRRSVVELHIRTIRPFRHYVELAGKGVPAEHDKLRFRKGRESLGRFGIDDGQGHVRRMQGFQRAGNAIVGERQRVLAINKRIDARMFPDEIRNGSKPGPAFIGIGQLFFPIGAKPLIIPRNPEGEKCRKPDGTGQR